MTRARISPDVFDTGEHPVTAVRPPVRRPRSRRVLIPLNVDLPETVLDALDEMADRTGRTKRDLVAEAIETFTAHHAPR